MKLLEEVKSHSSKWLKTKDSILSNFYWQNAHLNDAVGQGYGAFSVNPAEADAVIAYILIITLSPTPSHNLPPFFLEMQCAADHRHSARQQPGSIACSVVA